MPSGGRLGSPGSNGFPPGYRTRGARESQNVSYRSMNIPNTTGPRIMATEPEFTPAKSQASSNEAPAGFQSVAFALEGSGAIALIIRVNTTRFRRGEFGWSS